MNKKTIPLSLIDEFQATSTGHDILRYIVLPDLLGSNSENLLYFSGRSLARKFEIDSIEDIFYFYQKVSWGNLELLKEKKSEHTYLLMSDEIVKRIQSDINVDFKLEAGFLAESIEMVTNRPCECFETINKRLFQVTFVITFTD